MVQVISYLRADKVARSLILNAFSAGASDLRKADIGVDMFTGLELWDEAESAFFFALDEDFGFYEGSHGLLEFVERLQKHADSLAPIFPDAYALLKRPFARLSNPMVVAASLEPWQSKWLPDDLNNDNAAQAVITARVAAKLE